MTAGCPRFRNRIAIRFNRGQICSMSQKDQNFRNIHLCGVWAETGQKCVSR
jgi:hypothetical protein